MKITNSRQNLYLLVLSTFLLVFVLLFSFLVLIPKGKEYREHRSELYKDNVELRKYQDFNEETLEILKKLQADNRNVITAFDNSFNSERFVKEHKNNFNTLALSKLESAKDDEGEFSVYEVETTSQINSPKSFYDNLDALNRSNWIVGINFPINFKREGQMIRSSFTMKVYCSEKDSNTSK
jgi:hypothetical protein